MFGDICPYIILPSQLQNADDTPAWEVQKSSMQIITGLVNLVLCTSVSQDLRQEAAQVYVHSHSFSFSTFLIPEIGANANARVRTS